MDMRAIRYFVAVFEEGSVSAAAKRCFVAQPSISTTIAQLEDQLGTSLFLRHRKGVTPTPEAHLFYKSAVGLMGEFDALKGLFRRTEEELPLSIAVMPTVDSGKIGGLIKSLGAISERLSLRLVDLNEPADARIVSDHLRGKNEHFVQLWEEKYVLALPHGHRLTLQGAVALQDLHGVRFIERCLCERHDEVTAFLAKHRIEPVPVARAMNEEWAVALVAAGLGVAVVPESSVRNREDVASKPLKGFDLVRRVGIAHDPASSSSAALQLVLKVLESSKNG